MVDIAQEFREACCMWRARTHKGYTILCFIYAFACAFFGAAIKPIILAHNDTDPGNFHYDNDGNIEQPYPDEIAASLTTMQQVTYSLAIIFLLGELINLLLFVRASYLEA